MKAFGSLKLGDKSIKDALQANLTRKVTDVKMNFLDAQIS